MNINDKNKSKDFEFLFNAVLTLETAEDCYSFFEDLCTMQELISIAQRLRVAKLLTEKKIYNDIVKDTGASTATISRVNRTLNYGTGAYSRLLPLTVWKKTKIRLPKNELRRFFAVLRQAYRKCGL